jgi:hypothetical protein
LPSFAPRLSALLTVCVGLSAACNWNSFDDIQDTAAVRVFEAPSNYSKSRFGTVLTTLRIGADESEATSHVAVSAGPDSPVVFEDVWERDELGSGSSTLCRDKKKCAKGSGVGGALIAFDFWGTNSNKPSKGCVLSPGLPNAYVFCHSDTGGSENYPLELDDVLAPKTSISFSGAGLPPNYPLGVALISAFARLNSNKKPLNGTLYFQPDRKDLVPPNQRLDFIDPGTQKPFAIGGEEAGDYGYRVAVAQSTGQSILIAVSQPSQNRVIVARYDPTITVPDNITGDRERATYRSQTLACVKAPDASLVGFGKVLAFGDIDGDGVAELFAGIDPSDGQNGKKQSLYMFPGSGLPTYDMNATSCPLWEEPAVQVNCMNGVRGVQCDDTHFGAAVAVGDVDGDKVGDLIVGAPGADARGVSDAGVLWIIPGSKDHPETGGLDLENMTNLYAVGQKHGGRLGASVGAVRSRGRDEPVGGAPGEDRVYMFMCSELEGGSIKSYCLPKK